MFSIWAAAGDGELAGVVSFLRHQTEVLEEEKQLSRHEADRLRSEVATLKRTLDALRSQVTTSSSKSKRSEGRDLTLFSEKNTLYFRIHTP